MHGWSGHGDAGCGGRASFCRTFVLFCASVRFNSDLFNASTDEAIWVVAGISSMENMQEGQREAAGEQSVDDVCAWFGVQGED